MDVTCTRCDTVYEFEEGAISPSGMTVKCAQCGHLFKVRRPSSPPDSEPASDAPRWRVRRLDGRVELLGSLAELSRGIAEGRFDPGDEISGTGQVWKKLRDIAELSALFPQQDTAPRALGRASDPPPAPRPPVPSARPMKRTPRSRDPELHVMGTPVSAEGVPTVATSGPPPPPPPPPAASSARPTGSTSSAPRGAAPILAPLAPPAAPPSAAGSPISTVSQPVTPASPALDDLPTDFEAPRGSRRFLWLAIALPLLFAGIAAYTLLAREPETPAAIHPAREFLLRADEALASHRPARFEEAISEYTKALAFHEDDAHILSSISRVYAVWAQLDRSLLAEARESQAAASAIAELEARLKRSIEHARTHGERAAQRNPGNREAEVALSDALRLSGNLVAARAELDRASESEQVASAERLRVAALLAIDESAGDLRAGRKLAEQSVAQDPTLIRSRLLLVRCLTAEGDFEGARLHLDAVRRLAPDHPLVLDQSRAIDRARQPAEAEQPTKGPERPVPAPARAAEPSERPAATERVDSHELVERGERALEEGSVRAAQKLFEQALAQTPGLGSALIGLGYVALERSQTRIALLRFKPAARAGHAEAWIGLGDTYRRVGHTRDALDAYETYLKRFPKGPRRSIAERQVELLKEQLAGGASP